MSTELMRPYVSFIVLLCVSDVDPDVAFNQLVAHLRKIRKIAHSRVAVELVRDGLEKSSAQGDSNVLSSFEQIDLTVHKISSRPGWLKESIFIDTNYELSIAFRRGRLIALHLPNSVRDSFQTWLDKPPRPLVRRVAAEIFERSLLQGETRGLWLRGTHARSKTKADTKNIAGADLRQTLSPVEDQTYAMNSARSVLPAIPSRVALVGTVGTTPTRSLVWNKSAASFDEFAQCASELLELVAQTIVSESNGTPVFPLLVQPVFDFTNVWGAYDLSFANPTELPDGTADAKIAAAQLLESAVLNIEGKENSPDFRLDVGLDMCVGGAMRGRILHDDGHARLSLGLVGTPTDSTIAIPVCEALQYSDLITVYYASGHTFTHGTLYKPQSKPRPFGNWEWKDFAGYSIAKEKPGSKNWSPEQIHAAIGVGDDRSIFSWVVSYFKTGLLTCDDGPGEIADFIHVGVDDFTLSLIHVKGAANDSALRSVSATAYEVVVSQAVKNSMFLDGDLLVEHLKTAPVPCPGTWTDGVRQADRTDLIEAILERDARDKCRVIIVQPHVSEKIYNEAHSDGSSSARPSVNLLRLQRLENILNGGRPTVTGMGMGADLFVFGSRV
jgi:hypothetical protein